MKLTALQINSQQPITVKHFNNIHSDFVIWLQIEDMGKMSSPPCFYSHQSQDEHDELHVTYPGPGEGAGLHADWDYPGRGHAEVWQGARRGI